MYSYETKEKMESHGFDATGEVYSLDGLDIFSREGREAFPLIKNKHIKLRWTDSYNCRTTGKFIDPRARKNCVTLFELRKLILG